MPQCEDFPCCGHEAGCCPDRDPDTGEQLNMICVCGAKLPIDSRFSLCVDCMYPAGRSSYGEDWCSDEEDFDFPDSFDELPESYDSY
jgi:hypothetical protein